MRLDDCLRTAVVVGPPAVRDGVVLDLRYEARDIDQSITSPAKVDQWFELKTKGLTDFDAAYALPFVDAMHPRDHVADWRPADRRRRGVAG